MYRTSSSVERFSNNFFIYLLSLHTSFAPVTVMFVREVYSSSIKLSYSKVEFNDGSDITVAINGRFHSCYKESYDGWMTSNCLQQAHGW